MEAPLQPRYEGAERRRPCPDYRGPERRTPDPATEQDHAELYEFGVSAVIIRTPSTN